MWTGRTSVSGSRAITFPNSSPPSRKHGIVSGTSPDASFASLRLATHEQRDNLVHGQGPVLQKAQGDVDCIRECGDAALFVLGVLQRALPCLRARHSWWLLMLRW